MTDDLEVKVVQLVDSREHDAGFAVRIAGTACSWEGALEVAERIRGVVQAEIERRVLVERPTEAGDPEGSNG